jgi:Protein of unknown function (DUF502)
MKNVKPASLTVAPAAGGPSGLSARARLRNYFLTGLIVAGPLAITIYITWWFINLVDGWMRPLVPAAYRPETYLPFSIPGFGLVLAFIGLTLLGFLTANLVGKSLLKFGEVMLDRMPIVRGLYKGVKQIFETVFKQDGQSFRQVGLIEWPGEGLWSLCFITEPAQGALAEAHHRLSRGDGTLAGEGGRSDDRRRFQAPDVDGDHPAREPHAAAGGRIAGGGARGKADGGRLTIFASHPGRSEAESRDPWPGVGAVDPG